MNWKSIFYIEPKQRLVFIVLISILFVTIATIPLVNKNDHLEEIVLKNDTGNKNFKSFTSYLATKDSTKHQKKRHEPTKKKSFDKQYVKKFKPGEFISLNEKDSLKWKKVPGIGSKLSQRIPKYGNLLGGYHSISQLKEVYGITPERFEQISPFIKRDKHFKKIRINQQEVESLAKHPYIRWESAKKIAKYRKNSPIHTTDELKAASELPDSTIRKLSPYIDYQ